MYLVGAPSLQRWGTRMDCRSASPTAKAMGHPPRSAIDRLGYPAIVPHQSPRERLPQPSALLGDWCGRAWKGNSSCACW